MKQNILYILWVPTWKYLMIADIVFVIHGFGFDQKCMVVCVADLLNGILFLKAKYEYMILDFFF